MGLQQVCLQERQARLVVVVLVVVLHAFEEALAGDLRFTVGLRARRVRGQQPRRDHGKGYRQTEHRSPSTGRETSRNNSPKSEVRHLQKPDLRRYQSPEGRLRDAPGCGVSPPKVRGRASSEKKRASSQELV